ncbi:MAG: stalk domain-containing protein [Bacillota bacterium]|nr:stalk domain-containing protein [Bacillota bacterium]
MKKIICILLVTIMTLAQSSMVLAGQEVVLTPADAVFKSDAGVNASSSGFGNWNVGGYIGFKDVDLTGIKSIKLQGHCELSDATNGETFRIYIDDPLKGTCIGYVNFNQEGDNLFQGNITPQQGKHNLYIKQNYSHYNKVSFTQVILSNEEYKDTRFSKTDDSAIIDNYHDTWVAVDNVGRKLADYEEVGGLKGNRNIGMFYWDWHSASYATAVIASEVIAEHPEAKDDFFNKAWPANSPIFWAEPIYGFYLSYDYWVYRKQAELMADAGVDVIFMDYTNGDSCYIKPLMALCKAFQDARRDGINVPKVSAFMQMGGTIQNKLNSMKAMYFNLFNNDELKDLWFYWEGKPLIVQTDSANSMKTSMSSNDTEEVNLVNKMLDFFTIRGSGSRQNGPASADEKNWQWLVNYPQWAWGKTSDGRVECVNLGIAINQSYVYNYAATGVFIDPYAKDKNYTEGFGEDYRADATHYGYFFREQISRVLDVDPAFVFVDGWNEWHTVRSNNYSGFPNAFIDLYDDAGSRDIEPSRGKLGDDYYMQFVDFSRKYKGARKAPVASEKTTIDINGSASGWNSVGPEFINDNGGYERDADGFLSPDTGKPYHYNTKVNNAISRAKVARDDNNIYFYVQTLKDIVKGTKDWMHIYINIDRNHATGWEGYDYALNVTGPGELAKCTSNTWGWEKIADIKYTVNGNVLQAAIPRSLLGEEKTVDFEFKCADGCGEDGDILMFYQDGSCAPVGRFNYLYTEIEQTTLTSEQKALLKDTAIMKANSGKMIVEGGKMNVYEQDTRITPVMDNNVLYFPASCLDEIMGYGETKTVYDSNKNMLFVKNFELIDMKISNYKWIYTSLGSNEIRIDGELGHLSNPVKVINGMVYVPATLLSEGFGWTVTSIGSGVYAMAKKTVNTDVVTSVLNHIA